MNTLWSYTDINGSVYRLSFADPLKTTCLDQGYIYDDLWSSVLHNFLSVSSDHIVWYTVAAQSTDAMARGFPQSQQSIYSSADGDAIIKGLFPLSKFLVI